MPHNDSALRPLIREHTMFGKFFLKPAGQRAPHQESIISIVMLLERPRILDTDEVERAAEAAFELLFNDDTHKIIKVPNKPLHAIRLNNITLGVVCSDKAYFADSTKIANAASTYLARDVILKHTAWISVDFMGRHSNASPDEAFTAIGRMLGELIADDTLAFIRTPDGKIVPYDPCFRKLLQTGNAQEMFKLGPADPIVKAKPDDRDLLAAADEARRRLPEFLAAFASRRPDQHFGVKKMFTDGNLVEHMWIQLTHVRGTTLYGTLNNTPGTIRSLKERQPVSATAEEIEDWVYTDGKRTVGGFQIAVFQKRR